MGAFYSVKIHVNFSDLMIMKNYCWASLKYLLFLVLTTIHKFMPAIKLIKTEKKKKQKFVLKEF